MNRRRAPITACAALVLAGCTGGGGPEITVAAVGRADVVEIVNAPATVAARAQSTATSPASGTWWSGRA